MALDFTPLEESGVTQTEFSRMLGVSRMSIHHWRRGAEPHPLMRRHAQLLLDDLQEAITKRLLPQRLADLPPTRTNMEERWHIIHDVLPQRADPAAG